MPYKRSYRRTRRKRKMNKSTKSVATRALRLAKKVAASSEVKYHDIAIAVQPDWDGNGPVDLANIAQGLSDNNRIGDQVRVTSINFKWIAYNINSGCSYIRVIVIRDHQDLIGSMNDILQVTGNLPAFQSHYVHDKRPQYTVLFDKYFHIDNTLQDSQQQRWYKKLNFKIQYVASSTSVISKNQIKAFAISDVSPQATNLPELYGYMRLNYYDN